MARKGRAIYLVYGDLIDPAKEEEFNAWYNTEHLPELLAIPGVLAVVRVRIRLGAVHRGRRGQARQTGGVQHQVAQHRRHRFDALVIRRQPFRIARGKAPDLGLATLVIMSLASASNMVRLIFVAKLGSCEQLRPNRLYNALTALGDAMHEVNAAIDEMRREHDPLASHIFISRRPYQMMSDTKSGGRHQVSARLSWQEACDLGFRGDLEEWTRLLRAAPRQE